MQHNILVNGLNHVVLEFFFRQQLTLKAGETADFLASVRERLDSVSHFQIEVCGIY